MTRRSHAQASSAPRPSAEQGVRAAVDPDDQDGSAVLDLEVAPVIVCHEFSFRGRRYYNEVRG